MKRPIVPAGLVDDALATALFVVQALLVGLVASIELAGCRSLIAG